MNDYLPAVRKDYLPVVRRENPDVVAATRRLARLGSVLGLSAVLLVVAGLAGWAIVGRELADADGRGPWPLVLAGAVCLGLIGIGCGVLALVFGHPERRQAIGAVCVSLVAPLAVGIIALALFFASTTLSFGI